MEKIKIQVFKKIYLTFLWIIITNHIDSVWKSTDYYNFIWPQFVGPVIGRNMTFAMFCFLYHELLMLPTYALHIMHRAKYGTWKVSQFFLEYFADVVAGLIPVAITAGLATKLLIYLDSSSVSFQIFILILMASSIVILYPLADVWILLSEHEELMHVRRTRGVSRTRSDIILENRVHALCQRVGFPKENVVLFPSTSEQTTAFYFGFLSFRRIFVFQGINDYHPHEESHEDNHNHEPSPGLLQPPPPAQPQQEEGNHNQEQHHHHHHPSSQPPSLLSLTTKEVEAVIAHELGHWYYGHSGQTLWIWHVWHISFWILVYAVRSNETVLRIFRFWTLGDIGPTILPGAFVTYYIVLRLYYAIFELLSQMHSHWTEKEADTFAAVKLGYRNHFAKALIKIVMEQQTTFPSSDPVYQLCYHNHPSLVHRLRNISYAIQHAPSTKKTSDSSKKSATSSAL